jgi:5-methylcytosine-specific restriction endonuclease McrA
MAAPCGICGGRLGPIHYGEPSDSKHPLSFVIDEIKPIARWKQFGYDSPEAAAQDWNNLQAAHYVCNAMKGARIPGENKKKQKILVNVSDGEW